MSMKLSYDKNKVSHDTLTYWESVLKLVGCAGQLRAKIALRDNIRDESVSFRVEPVFNRYHGGSMSDLNRTIRNLQKYFFDLVEKINAVCVRHEVLQIKEPAKLLDLLQEKERRNYYNREAKKLLSQNKLVPLQSLEKKYVKKKQQGQAKA